MKRYLVTGGAGFIGSNFVLYMLGKYENIEMINLDKLTYAGNLENLDTVKNHPGYRFIQGDICDKDLVKSIFKDNDIDCVVNFAAESHVDRSISNPEIFAATNILGTVTLLGEARAAWQTGDDRFKAGCKFLQVSTDEVYGTLGPEGFFTESTPLDPHSPYSSSKASADLIVKAYADTYKFPINITRCSNNYGPFQFPEKLIPLMINNTLQHKSLPVYGDGMQVRDWLYVEDRKGHDRRYAIDPAKIKDDLGWYPETTFEVGIRKTIEWYLANKEWMEHITSGAYQSYYEEMYKNRM